MSDLRTGLVEAMAVTVALERSEAYGLHSGGKARAAEVSAEDRRIAAAALDAALGFLTDNAEAWAEAVGDLDFDPMGGNSLFPYKVTPEATAELVAFLLEPLGRETP